MNECLKATENTGGGYFCLRPEGHVGPCAADLCGRQCVGISLPQLQAGIQWPVGTTVLDVHKDAVPGESWPRYPGAPGYQGPVFHVIVTHRYAFRGHPGQPLVTERFSEFVDRVAVLSAQEAV